MQSRHQTITDLKNFGTDLLYGPGYTKRQQAILDAELKAYLNSVPQGDLDGDGIPNIADADADGDQLIDPLKGIDGVSDALLDRLIAAEVPRTRSYLDALNREKQKRIRNR